MAKILKFTARVFGIGFEWFLILFITFAFLIRAPFFQTFLAQKVSAFFSKEWNTVVQVGSVEIIFFDRLALDRIYVEDLTGKTLLYSGSLRVKLADFSLSESKLEVASVTLQQAKANILREKEAEDFNFQFIADYFASEDTTTSESKPFKLLVNEVNLEDLAFKYQDEHKTLMPFGVDFDNLNLTGVNLSVRDFELNDGAFKCRLKKLQVKDRSGLDIQNLSASLNLSDKGIKLRNLSLKTANSRLRAKRLGLLYPNWDAFSHFEDKVKFDIVLLPSAVNLLDVSYFVPDMEGMDALVNLSGEVKNALNNLHINDLNLRLGRKTYLAGNIDLPDVRKFFDEDMRVNLFTANIDFEDVERLKMPKNVSSIVIPEPLNKLGFVELSQLRFVGTPSEMHLNLQNANTGMGSVALTQTLDLLLKDNQLWFGGRNNDSLLVQVRDFQLGQFLDIPDLGAISVDAGLNGGLNANSDFYFKNGFVKILNATYNNYTYSKITATEAQLVDNELKIKVDSKDPYADFELYSEYNLGEKQHILIDLDLHKAYLGKLNFSEDKSISLSTGIRASLDGVNLESIKGTITANFLQYREENNELNIPTIVFDVDRNNHFDSYKIRSSILTASLAGEIDYETVVDDFVAELASVFPSFNVRKNRKINGFNNNINFSLKTEKLEEFLTIFVPGLTVSQGTELRGKFNAIEKSLNFSLNADKIVYEDFIFNGININQQLQNGGVVGNYRVNQLKYDSLHFDKIEFTAEGTRHLLGSTLTWEPNSPNFSSIHWDTRIVSPEHILLALSPSFFSLNGMRWEIAKEADIILTERDIVVNDFELKRQEQSLQVNGCVSQNINDRLYLRINRFKLGEIGDLLGLGVDLDGQFSGSGHISTPYTNLQYQGDLMISNLFVDQQEVGDISILTDWNTNLNQLDLLGGLIFRKTKTFDFVGGYNVKTELINLALNFKETDIAFANSFMDPEVVDDIKGKLTGRLTVKGKIEKPQINGRLKLKDASALVAMLGTKYAMDGDVSIVEDAFYINNMPIRDEDGNQASLIGSINHRDFTNFNFDLNFNFEDDFSKRPRPNGTPVPLEKFMVMNTKFKDGDIYFGKAYATGSANISGTTNKMEVNVDLTTKKGTVVNFPMYGVSDIDENVDFVEFVQKGIDAKQKEEKIDFTGVDLDLKFRVNTDAQLRIIFNELTGDEIIAQGNGGINVKLDQLNHITLNGDFEIAEGSKYNFALGVIKQTFDIEKGSKITWTGDPYNANIDIKTVVNMRKVSILELSPEQVDKTLINQDVLAYLNLTETLLNPRIGFDIKAPRAPETGKALIARVTSDPDELNRQFFSLLLMRKFQPLKGSISAGGSAAIDLVESQINAALGSLSDKFKLNVDYGADQALQENSVELGVKRGFMNDRIIVSGSFGVENKGVGNTDQSKHSSSLIGDVSVEFLINESGTFRANVFNRSNTNSVNEAAGPFTQGAGLAYREEFNSFDDFKLAQYFLDIFRKEKKYKIKSKRQQKPVPPLEKPDVALPKSEE